MTGDTALHHRFFRWGLLAEGSTRSSALIRIGLVFLLWGRWANDLVLYRDLSAQSIVLSLCFFAATTLMLLGVWTRVSTLFTAAVVLSMYYYFGQVLGREPWTHHHTYLLAISTFLCALTPCGRSYSVDRWLAVRRARAAGQSPPAERGPLWGLRLMAVQISMVYFWSAWDKTHWGFLSGDRLEHIVMWFYIGSNYPDWSWFRPIMTTMACTTVALEYALAIGLFVPKWRKWLLLAGLLLHGVFYVVLSVYTFSATMWLLYLAFLDADGVHRFLDRLQGHEPISAPAPVSGAGA